MNTTQTDNGKKQETAKEILDRCAPKWIGGDCVPRDQVLAAMKEIADKAWEAGHEWEKQHWLGYEKEPYPDKSTFMKGLFPEDIKDTSASG